jgi:hypothetical protein
VRGLASARTLPETAALVARGAPIDGTLWTVDHHAGARGHELRVIATAPRLRSRGDRHSLAGALHRLRRDADHALVVVDCGTLQRGPDRLALRSASHIAWVLPATARGRDCSERLFGALPSSLGARELIVARRAPDDGPVSLRALTALADARHAPLVLLPHLPREPQRALAAAQVSLQAILGRLER